MLKFSEATSGFKMDSRLFVLVYGSGSEKAVALARSAFESLKGKRDGSVDAFECFVCTALLASQTTMEERIRFCFGLFDLDGEGNLSWEDLIMLLKCCVAGIAKLVSTLKTSIISEELYSNLRTLKSTKSIEK